MTRVPCRNHVFWSSVVVGLSLLGCVGPDAGPASPDDDNPTDELDLFRDFKDGKYDSAGHPLNASVTEAENICADVGTVGNSAVALRNACRGTLVGSKRTDTIAVSAHLRVRSFDKNNINIDDAIATLRVIGKDGTVKKEKAITPRTLRRIGRWQDVSVTVDGESEVLDVEIVPTAGSEIVVDYVELFPQQFGIVLGPGAGVYANSDVVSIEIDKKATIHKVELDGVDITARWRQLVTSRAVKRTDTDFRSVYTVNAADIAVPRRDAMQFRVFSKGPSDQVATTEIRQTSWPCKFEGAAGAGKKILVTGFQPFPADGKHENVSAVAIRSARVSEFANANVMKVILPVEYDRAASTVAEIVARCQPDAVVSFGQGSSTINLEQTAYNLKDTSAFPDNRGIVQEATPIDNAASAERSTLLPIDRIEKALQAVGEAPQRSTDPGRYICNNVFFVGTGAMAARGGIGGFIHLPLTTTFSDADRLRFGKVVETVVKVLATP
jgi:pyroglutamyl-peptidase